MVITIINQAAGVRSYLGGIVTVAQGGSTTLPRDLNVPITSDAQFIFDITSETVILNNGATNLSGSSALLLVENLAQFSLDPLAMLFLFYSAPVNIRQTAATAAGSLIWAMRNPGASTLSAVIQKIFLNMSFDADTPLSNKLPRYDLVRFSTATPTGGTQITPIKASNLAPASAIDVRSIDTGLTTTGIVFETPFATISCPGNSGASTRYEKKDDCLKLAPGEGFGIRISTIAATIGQGIAGEITWSLR